MKIKLYALITFAAFLLAYSAYAAFNKNFFLSITTLLSTIYISRAIITNNYAALAMENTSGLAIIITLIGLCGVFITSDATNPKKVEQNISLYSQAVDLRFCPSDIQLSKDERIKFQQLREDLILRCGMQNNINLQDLGLDVAEVLYTNTTTGLANNIYSIPQNEDPKTCLSLAKDMNAICPDILETNSNNN